MCFINKQQSAKESRTELNVLMNDSVFETSNEIKSRQK